LLSVSAIFRGQPESANQELGMLFVHRPFGVFSLAVPKHINQGNKKMNKNLSVVVALLAGLALGGCGGGGGDNKAAEACKKTAAEMKLTGAAADDFVKLCSNPAEACKQTAAQMQLTGTASDDFVKQCTEAAKTGKPGK
jgi:hypothetical protein